MKIMSLALQSALLILNGIFYPSVAASNGAVVPDLAREKRMASEVEDMVLDGDVIYLKQHVNRNDGSKGINSDPEFMAIDTEAEGATKGAVIILHGRGFHPNWQDTVFPLRTRLPKTGWRTLSLQMPVLKKSAKYYDYVAVFPAASPRIEAGINYLKDQGIGNIVLLAHSCGAHMAMDWVRRNGTRVNHKINAFIGIGMGATDYKQPMKRPFPLEQLSVPVLDIYGEKEYPAVIRMAPQRLAAIKKTGNPKSAQIVVAGANHYFTDQDDALVDAVSGWLDSLNSDRHTDK